MISAPLFLLPSCAGSEIEEQLAAAYLLLDRSCRDAGFTAIRGGIAETRVLPIALDEETDVGVFGPSYDVHLETAPGWLLSVSDCDGSAPAVARIELGPTLDRLVANGSERAVHALAEQLTADMIAVSDSTWELRGTAVIQRAAEFPDPEELAQVSIDATPYQPPTGLSNGSSRPSSAEADRPAPTLDTPDAVPEAIRSAAIGRACRRRFPTRFGQNAPRPGPLKDRKLRSVDRCGRDVKAEWDAWELQNPDAFRFSTVALSAERSDRRTCFAGSVDVRAQLLESRVGGPLAEAIRAYREAYSELCLEFSGLERAGSGSGSKIELSGCEEGAEQVLLEVIDRYPPVEGIARERTHGQDEDAPVPSVFKDFVTPDEGLLALSTCYASLDAAEAASLERFSACIWSDLQPRYSANLAAVWGLRTLHKKIPEICAAVGEAKLARGRDVLQDTAWRTAICSARVADAWAKLAVSSCMEEGYDYCGTESTFPEPSIAADPSVQTALAAAVALWNKGEALESLDQLRRAADLVPAGPFAFASAGNEIRAAAARLEATLNATCK